MNESRAHLNPVLAVSAYGLFNDAVDSYTAYRPTVWPFDYWTERDTSLICGTAQTFGWVE